MISILIPSRGRVKFLDRTIKSIWDTSSSKGAVEILLRVDEDDKETINYLNNLKHLSSIQVVIGSRKEGYKSLPYFFNEIAKVAKGNPLMCCNDDVIFETKDWDKIIEEVAGYYYDGIFNIGVNTRLNREIFVFSVISKQWVEIVGYINDTRLFYSDVFLKDVSDALGRSIYLPDVIIEHDWKRTDVEIDYKCGIIKKTGEWTEEYKKIHNKVVFEVVRKLKSHLNLNIEVNPLHISRNALLRAYRKGRVYLQQEAYIKAVEKFDEALSLEPSTDIQDIRSEIIFYKGMTYLNQQRYDEVIELLDESLRSGFDNIIAYYTLGSCYKKRNEWTKSIERFQQVLSLETGEEKIYHAGAHFHLGEIYQSLDEVEKAKREFENCLKLIPDHKKARENLTIL